jgi:hypothetical protein
LDQEEDKDEEMEFQDPKWSLKAVYGHSNSDSSIDERRKMLHVIYQWLMGHYVPVHHEDPALSSGGNHTCSQCGVSPQVDGDVDWL